MTRLSVNINKIATLRNARGGTQPNVVAAAVRIQQFGAQGITVHPRPDGRHITYADVRALKPAVHTEFKSKGTRPTISWPSCVRSNPPKSLWFPTHQTC